MQLSLDIMSMILKDMVLLILTIMEKLYLLKKNHLTQNSNYAVSGLYFYPNDVVEIAKKSKTFNQRRIRNHRCK